MGLWSWCRWHSWEHVQQLLLIWHSCSLRLPLADCQIWRLCPCLLWKRRRLEMVWLDLWLFRQQRVQILPLPHQARVLCGSWLVHSACLGQIIRVWPPSCFLKRVGLSNDCGQVRWCVCCLLMRWHLHQQYWALHRPKAWQSDRKLNLDVTTWRPNYEDWDLRNDHEWLWQLTVAIRRPHDVGRREVHIYFSDGPCYWACSRYVDLLNIKQCWLHNNFQKAVRERQTILLSWN